MKQQLAVLFVAAMFAVPASAQEKKEMTEQQQRMQSCNADAKQRQFADNAARQAFMSACLKGERPAEAAKVTPQQQRMKDCNAEAGKQQFPSGRERQTFMTQCLRS